MSGNTAAIIKKILMALLFGFVGGAAALIFVMVAILENRPELKVWHEVSLGAEYTADSPVTNLEGYLALEEQLFRQLAQQVLDRLPAAEKGPINRYHRGSLSDPARWERNWNRTFELEFNRPAAGVLLLHGMSDAPYSLRALGDRLNQNGAWVVGLRLPGHGTIPSGLVHLKWEDMAAAVRLAMRHLKDRVGSRPIFLVGYSTGGALAMEYALETLDEAILPQVERIVLISPAMGVTRLAALSIWQARIGKWLGLPKLSWNSILPEYNPFKYSSFAINAGDQVYRLVRTIQSRLDTALATGNMERFPPVLTFQSVVDATVSTPAVITGLYNKLVNSGDELVMFDINHQTGVDGLLASDPLTPLRYLMGNARSSYVLSLVSNLHPKTSRVAVYRSKGSLDDESSTPLAWQWPHGIHSLSHIALPFSVNDPLYGVSETTVSPGIALSKITLRGERGVINIPPAEMLRLKWNPFYPYLEQRVMNFLKLTATEDPAMR